MKKLLVMIALFGLPLFALTGCGRSGENTVIEGGGGEQAGSMTDDQMSEYEAAMNAGEGSSGPGN